MKIRNFYPGSYASNCYLLSDEAESEFFLVDPSLSPAQFAEKWRKKENGAPLPRPSLILLTHAHFDHLLGLNEWQALGIPVAVSENDAPALTDPGLNGNRFFLGEEGVYGEADRLLFDGEVLPIGSETLTVIATPGHTPGSVCFDSGELLLTGDTVFAGGNYGRYDLAGGDLPTLRQSIRRILSIPGERILYSGHGIRYTLSRAREVLSNM